MVAASPPTVAASTASSTAAEPVGAPLPVMPWAATASAAVSSPAAIPRRRAVARDGSVVTGGCLSGHAETGQQVGVDTVELL